jgi:hypothetical protein
MNKQTWVFYETTGVIPGIPGTWHAGQEVDIDTDTGAILAVRTPGVSTDVQAELPTTQPAGKKRSSARESMTAVDQTSSTQQEEAS